jgi:DNA-binding SARP family transcriptional activator
MKKMIMPGGGIARRPLHVIIMADCSGSMLVEGEIQALNFAIAEMLQQGAAWERTKATCQVLIRAITFNDTPRWHVPEPLPDQHRRWNPLEAVPKARTNMAPVCRMAASELTGDERRAFTPVLLLITDGRPTGPDDIEGELASLMSLRRAGVSRDPAGGGLVVGLLGPVEVGPTGGLMAGVPQPQLRVLLGLLGVAAGRVVSAEALVDGVWGEQWSVRRERNLHALVYQLRRRLEQVAPGGGGRLERAGVGYRLVLGTGELDVDMFRELAGRGRGAARAGDTAAARKLFGQALALWRGHALADASPGCLRLAGEASRLEEARLAVVEERIGCDLALGAHGEVVGELAGLVTEFPLRERLACLLMTALYRCGRRGEALAAYDSSRRVLAEQLGLDPGPELAGLHAKVLADDRALADLAPAPAAPKSAVPTEAEVAAGGWCRGSCQA